uniref:Uncharacterized protein n=1 Tax=Romanomermis culicivorax TaxID=13658 RepID=A0A915HRD6_ROMCU
MSLGFKSLQSEVVIRYPAVKSILIYEDVMVKTEFMILGDVGGLLGIWTGGSIISLMQLLYVFCFSKFGSKNKIQLEGD